MHNNYALQHITLKAATYKQLQAAIANLKAQAGKQKQICKQRFVHVNNKHYTAKFTLAHKNIATLVA